MSTRKSTLIKIAPDVQHDCRCIFDLESKVGNLV